MDSTWSLDACCFLPFRPPSRSHNHPCTPAEGAAHKLEMPETARAGAEEEEVKPPPAPADEEEAKSARGLALARLNRRGLLANLLLVVGYALALWFQVYEYNGEDRQTIAIAVGGLRVCTINTRRRRAVDRRVQRPNGGARPDHAGNCGTLLSRDCSSPRAYWTSSPLFFGWSDAGRRNHNLRVVVRALVMAVLVFYFQINDIKPPALMLQEYYRTQSI